MAFNIIYNKTTKTTMKKSFFCIIDKHLEELFLTPSLIIYLVINLYDRVII